MRSKSDVIALHAKMHDRLRAGERNVARAMVALGLNLDELVGGNRALVVAAEAGNLEECVALLDAGATIDLTGKGGRTPVHDAVTSRKPQLVQILIDRGADIHVKDMFGSTPIHTGALYDSPVFCEILVASGASVDELTRDGRGPLHFAAAARSYAVCEWLIRRGAKLDLSDVDGQMPLHWAAFADNDEMCRLLVERGAVSSAIAQVGAGKKFRKPLLTPFQHAVREEKMRAARFFLDECGEDPGQRTIAGRTLIQLASKNAGMQALIQSRKTKLAIADVLSCPGEDSPAPQQAAVQLGVL